MKYPQLVSTRAVNAISDWLVSRLEQLGVEAPLIYSRLLLSLLHSSVQINDPIEFNNLETYLTNRRGQKRHHHHHYPPTDANTLKKLTAIQCLTEAVSSDQEITNIETLVDELCEKLNDIEKQIDSDDKEYQTIGQILNFITVVGSTSDTEPGTSVSTSSSSKATGADSTSSIAFSVGENTRNYNIRNKNINNLNILTKQRNNKSNKTRVIIDLKDIEDPRKRYYNAFPALTKEMEDSFRNSNRYTKALTWPNDKTTSFIQNHINNNNINNNNNNNINKQIANPVNNNLNSVNINNQNEMYIRSNSNNLNNINTAGVKRKPKRRRNQAMSKGRTSNNHQRKNSYSGNCSPTWDTDFEGSWEMGRDLYKEFIMKENNRNRSTSESAAYNEGISNSNVHNSAKKNNTIDEYNKCEKYPNLIEKNVKGNLFYDFTFCDQNKNLFASNLIQNKDGAVRNLDDPRFQYSVSSEIMEDEISSTTALPSTTNLDSNSNNLQINNIDQNNLLSDEGYSTHENLTSLSELDTSGVEVTDVNKNEGTEQNHYLYPAQHHLYQSDTVLDNDDSSMSLCSNIEQQQYDFAQFKAKFNSSVEALWKRNINDQNENSNFSTNSDELRSLPLVQQRQGLNNFWINYNNHRYDTNKIEHFDEDKNAENVEQRDFLSMPSGIKATSGSKETSSVFLQNSIWSDSVKNYDNDESFYACGKKSLQPKDLKENENNSYEHYYQNCPHDITKCQEGINEISIDENSLCSNNFQQQNSFSDLNHEMREIMLNNSNLYNFLPQNTPQNETVNFVKNRSHDYNEEIATLSKQAKQQFQTINLNENNAFQQNIYRKNQIPVKQQTPPVSLENHSKASAFIEYSSIKKESLDNFSQSNYVKEYLDNSNYAPTYGEDENLLTSDRTHFRPIKQTYADGYVFDICNYLDEIEYERSQSGFLCYDGEKYLEFLKTDGGTSYYENKQNSLTGKTSNAQISKDCDKTVRSKYDEFVLKFRVNNKNEKGCQTDPPPISPQEINFRTYIDLQLMNSGRLNQNFHNNYFNQFMSESESENASNYYYFEEENRSSTSTDEYEKFDGSFIYNTSSNKNCSNIESAKAAAAVIIAAVANNNNQYDSSKKLQEWSMFDIRKKCNANTSLSKYNGNNNENHTLWGTCPACNANEELESTPANRLLKDELRIEGDEIMSDLKYMQDLYIGSDWEEGTCSSSGRDSDNFASDIIETDYEIDKNSENNLELNVGNKTLIKKCDYYSKEKNENSNVEEYSSKDESQQTDIYYNVTKLIADLLKPENAKSLANALGEAAIQAANVQAKISSNNYNMEVKKPSRKGDIRQQEDTKIEGFCGGLWASDEHVIWKHNELRPIDNYLTQFNINNNNNDLIEINSVSGKLDWEYSNLADIWKQEMQLDSAKNCFKDVEIHNEKENFQLENLKHMKFDIKENNSKISKNFFEFDQNNPKNIFNTISNQNTERASNISQYNKLLKESISDKNENKAQSTTNENPSKVNINSNSYFGINKKNNRFDRKRRHSASQMVTSSCNKDVISIPTEEIDDNSKISSSNNNDYNQIQPENASKFNDKNLSNTTINNIFGKGKENLKFEISNNCRNFLNNCQNIIGGGDLIKDKNNFNFCENLIIGGNKIELMTTAAKDLLIKTNLNDYVVGIDDDNDDDDDNNDNDDNENDDSKVTSTTNLIEKTSSSNANGARIISYNYVTFAKDFNSNNSAFWPKGNSYLDYDYDNIGGISTSINPSSILKHVALVSRPLTR